MSLINKLIGTADERYIKRLQPTVKKILDMDEAMQKLSDEELKNKTEEFKNRLNSGETLDSILPEAYAVVREATVRVMPGIKLYPVQLIGGIVLHQGKIAELATGQGKTNVATLPAYLNALTGKGVHVVTVNDYLASRDAEWMGKVYRFLGLTVGCILNGMSIPERQKAYACDITYGTNNEFGFDYLKDNMVAMADKRVQRGLNYAIIDEVDSVLIDEARTPLIISGIGTEPTLIYSQADSIVSRLKKGRLVGDMSKIAQIAQEEVREEGDFFMDEKEKTIALTAEGVKKVEKFFGLKNYSDPENTEIAHCVNNALRARFMMFRDKDYVVQDGEVIIVDEFTGRLMPGRRFNDGLHQAIEAKEGVRVQEDSKTLATITFQNFFNKYTKKAGMTGTAKTEEDEFKEIYHMPVIQIPTHQPVQRIDQHDLLYKNKKAKYKAVIREIVETHKKGQPVLVGTIAVEDSEKLSALLSREGVPHQVLNAKNHAREAEIISHAGEKDAVTIATNMAGRGTDIKLGEGVAELGGLKVIGTERHESRRIDNQLRGRSGRQGDPGESRFYVSLEDDLIRIFGGERMHAIMEMFNFPEDEPIEDKRFTNAVSNAQKKMEANNFGIRKHLLDYDKVMNEQREMIYGERNKVLEGVDMHEEIRDFIRRIVHEQVEVCTANSKFPEEWDLEAMKNRLADVIPIRNFDMSVFDRKTLKKQELEEKLLEEAYRIYDERGAGWNPDMVHDVERTVLLKAIDKFWMEQIDMMDQMRKGIGLQAYGQKKPIDEYRFAAAEMFAAMNADIVRETVRNMYKVTYIQAPDPNDPRFRQIPANADENKKPRNPYLVKSFSLNLNGELPHSVKE